MDSYIENEVEKYVKKDKNSYAYWGRAGYFWKHFKHMDLNKIFDYKQKILDKKGNSNE